MESRHTVLDINPNFLDTRLKFVKNDLEEEFDSLFGEGCDSQNQVQQQQQQQHDSIVVKPIPGMCIKCFNSDDEKFFINLCQTDAIPAPEDITEDQLGEILESETPSSYRIPMSISEPRPTTDKSGNQVDVCDIAINPKFFQKCEKVTLFRDFLVVIMLEAMADKYGIHLKPDNWIVLKNRKSIGYLVSHRIQNRDAKKVYDSYKNPSVEDKKKLKELNTSSTTTTTTKKKKVLIEEIVPEKVKVTTPEYQLFAKKDDASRVCEVFAEFYLPKCLTINDFTLDVGGDRIVLESKKYGYFFDNFIEYDIDQMHTTARFDKKTKMLQLTMPTVQSP